MEMILQIALHLGIRRFIQVMKIHQEPTVGRHLLPSAMLKDSFYYRYIETYATVNVSATPNNERCFIIINQKNLERLDSGLL
jgi:hypothetical protein